MDYKFLFKEVSYDRKKFSLNLFLNFFSITLIALFPLLTQFYLKIAFQRDINYLLISTAIVFAIYILKFFADVKIERFETKLFIKLAANIQEKLLVSMKDNTKNFSRLYNLLERDVNLYVLFVRKFIFANAKAIIKSIILLIFILFFDYHLFIYALLFIPIFAVYIFLLVRLNRKNRNRVSFINKKFDFDNLPSLIQHYSVKDISFDALFKKYKKYQSLKVEKDIRNKTSLIYINQYLSISLTLFRVLYLSYFGYFVITQNLHLNNLIVGLLFITIFASSLMAVLRNILFYTICESAVNKIQSKINK